LEIVVGMLYWLVIIIVLVALWYAGMLRPTGLVGRTRAEEERESANRTLLRNGSRRTAKIDRCKQAVIARLDVRG